jgi:hypothetical protein
VGDLGVSSRELVDRVWHEVARREALVAEPIDHKPFRPAPLEHDPERHYINARWKLDTAPAPLGGVGALASVKARMKRRAGLFVVAVLDRYFSDESEFLAHLVRYQNNVADAHDQLALEVASLDHAMRVESHALKQRMAIVLEAVEELQRAPRHEAGSAST